MMNKGNGSRLTEIQSSRKPQFEHGGLSHRHVSGTNQPIKALRQGCH